MSADKNILFIGPNSALSAPLRKTAPQGLTSALKGKTLNGTGRVIASDDRFASNDVNSTLRLYAARQAQAGRIRQGGVAALYPSPLSSGKVMGVITNVPGRSFSTVANDVIKPSHWNRLEGSVSRWNNSNVLMAQTAMNIPGYSVPKPKTAGLSDMASSFTLPSFDLPKANWESFEFGEIDTQSVKAKLGEFRTQILAVISGRKISEDVTAKTTQARAKKVAAPAYVPAQRTSRLITIKDRANAKLELRGYSTVQEKSQNVMRVIAGTNNWAKTQTGKIRQSWQRFDLESKLSSVKSGEINMNLSALMLILIFGSLFLLLGLARPSSRLSGRH